MLAERYFKIWLAANNAIRNLVRTWRDAEEISVLRAGAPSEVRRYLNNSPIVSLRNSSAAKKHSLFQVGDDKILHLYDMSVSPIERALDERRGLKNPSGLRVPQIHCAVKQGKRLWLLEEKLGGETLPRVPGDPDCLQLVQALATLADQRGVGLQRSAFWQAHHDPSVEASPSGLRKAIRKAWREIGDISSVPMHGDVQPKNVLSGSTIALVDWEGFWLEGLPGLDLAFFAIMSDAARPSRSRFAELVRGEGTFSKALKMAYPCESHYRAGLLVMLALWTNGENKRLSRDEGADQPRPFRSMIERFGPLLQMS